MFHYHICTTCRKSCSPLRVQYSYLRGTFKLRTGRIRDFQLVIKVLISLNIYFKKTLFPIWNGNRILNSDNLFKIHVMSLFGLNLGLNLHIGLRNISRKSIKLHANEDKRVKNLWRIFWQIKSKSYYQSSGRNWFL